MPAPPPTRPPGVAAGPAPVDRGCRFCDNRAQGALIGRPVRPERWEATWRVHEQSVWRWLRSPWRRQHWWGWWRPAWPRPRPAKATAARPCTSPMRPRDTRGRGPTSTGRGTVTASGTATARRVATTPRTPPSRRGSPPPAAARDGGGVPRSVHRGRPGAQAPVPGRPARHRRRHRSGQRVPHHQLARERRGLHREGSVGGGDRGRAGRRPDQPGPAHQPVGDLRPDHPCLGGARCGHGQRHRG